MHPKETYAESLSSLSRLFESLKSGTAASRGVDDARSDVSIKKLAFRSDFESPLPMTWSGQERARQDGLDSTLDVHGFSLQDADENTRFPYYIVLPASDPKPRGAIFLLHGLNEKSWDKYLPWAAALCRRTGKGVILFPIAFHMDRVPRSWTDRRILMRLASLRKERYPGITEVSFINAALSSRLHEFPGRFLLSGLQTYRDIISLTDQIAGGAHQVFPWDCSFDFFGYSIGALLAEILLMADPGNRFAHSRGFLFCGGSTMDLMRPVSRYIMDSGAERALLEFMDSELTVARRTTAKEETGSLLQRIAGGFQRLGQCIGSMLDLREGSAVRNARFRELGPRLGAVALAGDEVMPGAGVVETLGRFCPPGRVEVSDFPFPYSHEQPFPLNGPCGPGVDEAFDHVFSRAAEILGRDTGAPCLESRPA